MAIGISGPCEGIGGVEVGGKGPAPGAKAGSCATFGCLVIGRGRGRGRGGGSEAFWTCLLFVGSFAFGFGLGFGLGFGWGLRLSSSSSSSEVSSITSDVNRGDDFWMRCRVLALSAIVPGMGASSVNMLMIDVSAAFSFPFPLRTPGEVKRAG